MNTYMDALFEIEKPIYSIPSMSEINTRDNGFTAVSTFSGCGGSSLGLKMAGWRISYAVEFIEPARDTYQANFPDTFIDSRDIRLITAEEILQHIGLQKGDLDLFEGSPPCSSFSTANTSKKARIGANKVKDYSDGVSQTTDDLFDEWMRLLEGLMPRAFVAENVPGMMQADAEDFLNDLLQRMRDLGYYVEAKIYNVAPFGAATGRRRLIFQGIRKDLNVQPIRPSSQGYNSYTIREAIEALQVTPPEDEMFKARSVAPSYQREWALLKPGESSDVIFQVTRCSWDRPAPTFTQSGGRGAADPMHPDECRKFTATEIAWFTGFPTDFKLTGTPAERYERVARAVPPPLYRAVGEALTKALEQARVTS